MRTGVGVIGYGAAGAAFHAPLVAAEPRLRLDALVTSREREAAARWPDARVLADPAALWADPGVGLVVVATPNATHVPLAVAALDAGKHVVVDKPLATTAAQARALAAHARARGLVLTVFHNRRWDGDFLTARALLAAGRLGEPVLAELCWDRFRPAAKPGWREQPVPGAGLLADLGPHLVDQALTLFGPPDAVMADLGAQRDGVAVDDWFDVRLRRGRLRVRLSASTLAAAPRPRFAIHGTEGSFVKDGLDPQEATLRAGGSPGGPGYGEEPPERWGVLTDAAGRATPTPTARGDWRRFYAGVADALAGAPPPVDPEDAALGLDLLELARASAAAGRELLFSPLL